MDMNCSNGTWPHKHMGNEEEMRLETGDSELICENFFQMLQIRYERSCAGSQI